MLATFRTTSLTTGVFSKATKRALSTVRVCIVGAGPAGYYTAQRLLKVWSKIHVVVVVASANGAANRIIAICCVARVSRFVLTYNAEICNTSYIRWYLMLDLIVTQIRKQYLYAHVCQWHILYCVIILHAHAF